MKNVLVIGSGGREHAICTYLSRSIQISQIFVLPGNGGTKTVDKCQNLKWINYSLDDIVAWCFNSQIDFVVVGPEEPLIAGITDKLKEKSIPCFGPSAFCAQLEGSKIFAKEIMISCNIPTADYVSFTDTDLALSYLKQSKDKMLVVKADGVAAGKGVIVAKTKFEAENAVKEMLNEENPKFGTASRKILIEQKLEGQEISILAFSDGKNVFCFPPCQDHKRIFDGDKGPNTGGMGAYCPCDLVDNYTLQMIKVEIIQKIIDHMRAIGHVYQGILYAGIMLTASGPYVLEFNCRFGDPETQVLLPNLKSDLFEIMMACTVLGGMEKINIELHSNIYTLCVVLTSGGYPDSYGKGFQISGLDLKMDDNVQIVHAGTNFIEEECQFVTSGGRVLGIVASGTELFFCYNLAMATAGRIHFQDCFYRKDIGYQMLKKNVRTRITYSGAGVNIAAGDELVNYIRPFASNTNRPGTVSEIGSFGALFDLNQCKYKDPLLVSGTDGVGTKLKISLVMDSHDTIGQDLVAMCVNDILCHGAEPLYFLDYLATSKLNVKMSSEIIIGIAKACQEAGCCLIGGETAEMPGFYVDNHYDLAGFAVGVVERCDVLPKFDRIKPGDKIIGLISNGLHSNGFSLVRKLTSSFSMKDFRPFGNSGKSLGDLLLAPTTIYVKPVLQILRHNRFKDFVHSIAHVTGGGLLENIPRALPENLKAEIDTENWSISQIFRWLWKLSNQDFVDFAKTFNLGIGMALVVSDQMSLEICNYLSENCSVPAVIIGEVSNRKFKTENRVVLKNFESSITDLDGIEFDLPLSLKSKTKVGVLISGSGTNLEALLKYSRDFNECSYEIVLVLSNVDNVRGLDIAKMYGVPTKVLSHKAYSNRDLFDEDVDRILSSHDHGCQLICLAGFMRILGKAFIEKWYGKIINIHPSLLPSFKGAHAHRQVLKSGVKLSGATVHFVIEDVDGGGIISQASTKVFSNDTEESLSERIKTEVEHKLYPETLHLVASGQCFLDSNNKVQWPSENYSNL